MSSWKHEKLSSVMVTEGCSGELFVYLYKSKIDIRQFSVSSVWCHSMDGSGRYTVLYLKTIIVITKSTFMIWHMFSFIQKRLTYLKKKVHSFERKCLKTDVCFKIKNLYVWLNPCNITRNLMAGSVFESPGYMVVRLNVECTGERSKRNG